MSIEAEFLEYIRQNPDDDAPRLVYADWLEEQEQWKRAEFIRVQCELARLPEDDPRRLALELRQYRLLRWYGWQWWHDPFNPFKRRPDFIRGFVEEISLYLFRDEEELEKQISKYTVLRVLRLWCRDEDKVVALVGLPAIRALRHLEIWLDYQLGMKSCWALRESSYLERTEIVQLSASQYNQTGVRALKQRFGDQVHFL